MGTQYKRARSRRHRPAIANAVYDAVGIRVRDLPTTPEKVLAALRERDRLS